MRNLITTFVLLGFFNTGLAAIQKGKPSVSVAEILAMPEANQLPTAMAQKTLIYPELINIVQNRQEAMVMRWRAFALAAALSPVQTLPIVEQQVNSVDWYMRNATLVIAEKYYSERAFIYARKLLSDKALVVRSAAVEVLAKKLTPADRDLLWAEYSENRNMKQKKPLWIKGKIVAVLGKNPLPREGEIFQRLLSEDDLKIKVASIKALENIHKKKLGNASDSIAMKAELWKKFSAKSGNTKI